MDEIVYILMMIGTFALSISGSLTSMEKRFDAFGVLIIAFVTAVGGGSLRDMIVDREVFWLSDASYIYIIIAGSIFSMIFRKKLNYLRTFLLLFDTIGLALFTILGAEIGLNHNLDFVNSVILATITGVAGGVLRDVLVNEIPVIFKKEIYATISIAGSSLYLFLKSTSLNETLIYLGPIFIIIILRLVVVYFKISLPSIYRDETPHPQT